MSLMSASSRRTSAAHNLFEPNNSYNGWQSAPSNLVEYKRFLHITNSNNSLQKVCSEIVERYIRLYPDGG